MSWNFHIPQMGDKLTIWVQSWVQKIHSDSNEYSVDGSLGHIPGGNVKKSWTLL